MKYPAITRIAVALAGAFIMQAASAAEPVATVNGTPIPATRAEVMLEEQRAQGMEESAELNDAVREELIRREVLSQAAAGAGIEERVDVQAQMELARQAILIRAYLQDYMQKNPISDEAVKQEYERISERVDKQEYRARHILVETDTEAKALIARLRSGEDFGELAKESKDPGSRENGGDLGWQRPSMFVEAFADALRSLDKGEMTQTPVESEFGWHVIQLDDTREVATPEFDLVAPELKQRMQQRQVERHLTELREKARID